MFAQPSPSRETYTCYSDGESVDQGEVSQGEVSQGKGGSNQELLAAVLGETLIRNQENSEQLVASLRLFCQQHAEAVLDESLFVLLAKEVLRHRLGAQSSSLPSELYDEVGRALWANAESRTRVERFWKSLGEET